MDASLCDRDCLLLHGFVNSHLVLDVHLVELINAADTVVSKHQCSSFNTKLARFRIFSDTGSQTGSTTCLATGVNSSWQELTNILKELTFCSGWISDNTNVDVSTQLQVVTCLLWNSTKELKEQSLLNI